MHPEKKPPVIYLPHGKNPTGKLDRLVDRFLKSDNTRAIAIGSHLNDVIDAYYSAYHTGDMHDRAEARFQMRVIGRIARDYDAYMTATLKN